jgi:hypothetical protein
MAMKNSQIIPRQATLEATDYAEREAEFVTSGTLLAWVPDDMMPIEMRDLTLFEKTLQVAASSNQPTDYKNYACAMMGIFFGILGSLGPLHIQMAVPLWLTIVSAAVALATLILTFVFWRVSKTIKQIQSDKIGEALTQIQHIKTKYKKRGTAL